MCSSRFALVTFAVTAVTTAQPRDPALSAALQAGRHIEALRLADDLLRTRPKDPSLWTARGLALDGMSRGTEGLSSFDRALTFNPTFLPALRAAAQSAYRQKDSRAGDYIKRLLAIEPENAVAHGMAAVAAFEKSDCHGAVAHFSKAGGRVDAEPVAASMYAQCLLRLGRASQAVSTLTASLSLNPSNRDLRYNLAVAQSAAGEAVHALTTLKPIESSPGALSLIGTLRAQLGDLEGALAALTEAVRRGPIDEQLYVDLTLLCTRMSHWSRAREVADEGLKRVPASARLYSIRGVCRLQLGDVEGAAADFDQGDRLAPARAFGEAAQGLMLSGQGQPEEAVRRLRDALRKQPGDPLLQFLLADLLERMDAAQDGEAISLLEASIAVRPDFAPAQALLGKLHRVRGAREVAIRHLEAALRIDPGNRQASQQLILALRQVGRTSDAERVAARLKTQLDSKQPANLSITPNLAEPGTVLR